MDAKDLQKTFRAAPWASSKEIEIFLLAADVVPPAELLKMLAVLGDRTAIGESAGHRARNTAFKRLVENSPDPGLFVPFVKALKTADPVTRQTLGELLPRVNHVSGHAELAALLRQQDTQLRRVVTTALKALGGKSVFDLTGQLAREDIPGRTEALDLCAQIGGYHAVGTLEYVLTNAKGEHRLQALKLLGDPKLMAKDTAGALAAIGRALGDPQSEVLVQAIASYAALCTEDQFHERLGAAFDAANLAQVKAVIDGARRFGTARTIAALERRFRIGPNAIRLNILNTLEAIGDDSTLPLLTEALNQKHVNVRARAGEVLSTLAIARKVNLARTLMWLLRSRDVNVRRIAVDIAKKVGDPTGELWPSLLRFLRDEDWWVRERVIDALVSMAGSQLTRHIVGYLQDPSDVVRRYAVDVLLRLKDPQALGALVRVAMNDADWWVRERALEAAGATKDARAIPYVVDLLQKVPELRLACLAALSALDAKAAAPQVVPLLGAEEVDVRLAALNCLAVVGDPSLADPVSQSITDVDHRVRLRSKELLALWNVAEPDLEWGTGTTLMSPLDKLLVLLARSEGDDLLIAPGRPPYLKKHGKVLPIEGAALQSPETVRDLLWPHLSEAQRVDVEARRDVDFSHEVKTEGLRFRANVFQQSSGLGAVFRIVKDKLLTMEELGVPKIIQTFGEMKNGLVLVGGPTGSGKSTTLAAIIDQINRTSARHIVTLEDPIEVVHRRKSSLVNQREIGTHTRSFSTALRSVLREDPDVLLVGEMRDLATIAFAVTAAETGHLVFGTLHTVSADTTVDRLVNAFPSGQQAQVRSMLAESLRAVVCQHLLRRRDRPGRVLSVEVMINNDAISNLIRKGKAFQIPSMIATQKELGMQTMDWDLRRLVKEGIVDPEEAYMKAISKKDFEELIKEIKEGKVVPPAPPAAAPPPGTPAAGLPVAPRPPSPTVPGLPRAAAPTVPSMPAAPARPPSSTSLPGAPPGPPPTGPVTIGSRPTVPPATGPSASRPTQPSLPPILRPSGK